MSSLRFYSELVRTAVRDTAREYSIGPTFNSGQSNRSVQGLLCPLFTVVESNVLPLSAITASCVTPFVVVAVNINVTVVTTLLVAQGSLTESRWSTIDPVVSIVTVELSVR